MLAEHFPPFGLRVRTPRLELRLPDSDELAELADLAIRGIHPPDTMPFLSAWSVQEPALIARHVVQKFWRELGTWTPEDWRLHLCVFYDGTVIGRQGIGAQDLARRKEVGTGSWLGQDYQGKGFGTEMRAAVLHLAFAGLGAEEAVSSALQHNAASQGVSRKLGYTLDGVARQIVSGELVIDQRMRLTRAAWEQHRTVEVTIEGLDACRPWFGLS